MTMILADTSIWIDHLRSGNLHLQKRLMSAEIVCHPFIIGEMACGNLKHRTQILSLLRDLPSVATLELNELLYFIEQNKLTGVGIGFVDVHLLASAQLARIPLWTADKRLQKVAQNMYVAYYPASR